MAGSNKKQKLGIGNAGLKLISLALALLLETYFYSQDNSVTQLVSAVIEITNLPENRLIVEPSHAEEGVPAHLEVRGPRSVVQQIARAIHVVKVPYPSDAPLVTAFDVPYELLGFPPSVRIESMRPARLKLRTVETITQQVPVRVPVLGSPAEGYVMGDPILYPKNVILRGPRNELRNIEFLETKPVDVHGLKDIERFELFLVPPGKFTSLSTKLVRVEIPIHEVEIEREFHSVLIEERSGFLERKSALNPVRGQVVVKGPASIVRTIDEATIRIEVDTSGVEGSGSVKVENVIGLPEAVSIVRLKPDIVVVKPAGE